MEIVLETIGGPGQDWSCFETWDTTADFTPELFHIGFVSPNDHLRENFERFRRGLRFALHDFLLVTVTGEILAWKIKNEVVLPEGMTRDLFVPALPLRTNCIQIVKHFLEEHFGSADTLDRLHDYSLPQVDFENLTNRFCLAVRHLESGWLKVEVVKRWRQHELAETESILPAAHGLWLPRNILFLPSEIEDFERLLNATPPAAEEEYQAFFEVHPKWLYLLGEQYEEARSQVHLSPLQTYPELVLTDSPVDQMLLIPDFFLKRIGLDLWDVLDIKPSNVRMIVGRRSRRKFSEAVSEAVAQLREYAKRLEQREIRTYLQREYNLVVSEPDAIILIGRDFDFKTRQEKSMFRHQDGVRVYTYDDLHRLAKHRSLAI
jgi:hypothetical protein